MPCVYILTNPAIPGLLKIGYTGGTAHDRAAEISRGTGVPSPYAVHWFMDTTTTDAAYDVEQAVHRTLASQRHNRAREFFTTPIAVAIDTIERTAYQQGAITNNLAVVARMLEEERVAAERAAVQRAANEAIRKEQQRVAAVKKAEQDIVDTVAQQHTRSVKAAENYIAWPLIIMFVCGFILMIFGDDYKNKLIKDTGCLMFAISGVLFLSIMLAGFVVKAYCIIRKRNAPAWAYAFD